MGNHLSGLQVALQLKRRYLGSDGQPVSQSDFSRIWSCTEWGLHMPLKLPLVRCALTAPFHPYRREVSGGLFLLHCPWGCPRRPLAVILPCGARTFLTKNFVLMRLPGLLSNFLLLLVSYFFVYCFFYFGCCFFGWCSFFFGIKVCFVVFDIFIYIYILIIFSMRI